ncbi:MAG: hypothetical protein H7296_06105 [Bacteroidia bacterium]|nr:hypothetical protein [Bacteroidia bacterium]
MKKTTFIKIITGLLISGINACSSPTQKVEHAQENLIEAKQELAKAKQDSIVAYETFKKESEERISSNEKVIAAFKLRMITDKTQLKVKDQKMIDGLEQKNIDMRKMMAEYNEKGKDEWESFKTEFNHDMDELGKAMNDLTVKNPK